ncbi:tRNA (N6-threonylcarbamoyladenosine(37)-N6)-methyltransferase TrmO [Nocardia sp. NPDC051030]|uniref:tRNA (N6-threonylcarbamoyladenosine(37)-N6)-methyltransferase TrmO n=1 Tax=Nocardia sp. NPDC051030 TaxID=3155162 RepID=UPI00341E9F66
MGRVRSALTDRALAPRQGDEGAPSAEIVFEPEFASAAADLRTGMTVLVLTWLHEADREALVVHPRCLRERPPTGVFATRSPDRPNPIGLHPVRITAVSECSITVDGLEAIDGTPVLDVKPTLGPIDAR